LNPGERYPQRLAARASTIVKGFVYVLSCFVQAQEAKKQYSFKTANPAFLYGALVFSLLIAT
jgi:hypothetical protein